MKNIQINEQGLTIFNNDKNLVIEKELLPQVAEEFNIDLTKYEKPFFYDSYINEPKEEIDQLLDKLEEIETFAQSVVRKQEEENARKVIVENLNKKPKSNLLRTVANNSRNKIDKRDSLYIPDQLVLEILYNQSKLFIESMDKEDPNVKYLRLYTSYKYSGEANSNINDIDSLMSDEALSIVSQYELYIEDNIKAIALGFNAVKNKSKEEIIEYLLNR